MNDNLTPAQRYYQRHKEQRRAYGRHDYIKNRDRILARAEERRAERDEEEFVANYVAERDGSMADEVVLEHRHNVIHLTILPEPEEPLTVSAEMPIEKIVPVAQSPLDAYRGRGVHNKIPARSKNVGTSAIKVSGPVVVSFS